MQKSRRGFLGALLLGAALACGLPAGGAHAQDAKPLVVYAASSLTDAMKEIGPLYKAAGHLEPVFSYGASSALARQIEQGAKADVFASADEPWADYLAERKLIDPATRASLLSNTLVLVSPTDKPLKVKKIAKGFNLAAALGDGKLAMADPDSVPAGKYGKAALENLGVWASVENKVARAENVRAALRFVETGDAAAGIVYATDALASGPKVKVVGEFRRRAIRTSPTRSPL
ncbi:MAG: molybdate ABC transporter substrate-binding protein [Alphaproteobacteria bacterium]